MKQSNYYAHNNNKELIYNKKMNGITLMVKSNGEISTEKGIIVPFQSNSGYQQVNINGKIFLVHNIVAYTFLYKDIKEYKETFKDQKFQINHKDNNILNNHINNLCVTTVELNLLNRKKFNTNNKFKGVYSINKKRFEITGDLSQKYEYYVVVFKGKYIDKVNNEEEAANIYDRMLITYVLSKYKTLEVLNKNILNNDNNLLEYNNPVIVQEPDININDLSKHNEFDYSMM